MGQRNGLVTAPKLGAPFTRRLPSALVDFDNGTSENPVVTYLEQEGLYVAVFDTLKHDPPPHGRSQQFRVGFAGSPNAIQIRSRPICGRARLPRCAQSYSQACAESLL